MTKLAIHPVGLAVTIFGLLVWIIALGGVGAATYSCQKVNSYEFCAKNYQVSREPCEYSQTVQTCMVFAARSNCSRAPVFTYLYFSCMAAIVASRTCAALELLHLSGWLSGSSSGREFGAPQHAFSSHGGNISKLAP